MENLNLPHPKQIDVAVPANLRCGKPENDKVPRPADWGPVRRSYAGLLEIDPEWVAEHLAEVHVLDVRQPEELADRLGRIADGSMCPVKRTQGPPGGNSQGQAGDSGVPRRHAFRPGHGHPSRCRVSSGSQSAWRHAFVAADGAAGAAEQAPWVVQRRRFRRQRGKRVRDRAQRF